MPATKVIDISDSNKIPEDLKAAKAAGVIGMIHQATSGTNLTDAKAEARVFLARDAGLLVGLYHCLSSGTIRRQAEAFVTTVESLGLEDDWLLAVQVDGKTSVEEVLEFLELVEQRTRRKPVLRAGSEFLGRLKRGDDRKVAEYRLWLEQHESAAQVPVAWGKYFLWQFTDEGEVDGVEGDVGCNDSLIQEADKLKKSWSGFKGRQEGEAPEENGEDVQIQEPTVTPEGELDNADASTEGGTTEETSEHPPETPDNTLPTPPPTAGTPLPTPPPTAGTPLPGQPPTPTTPDNTLPPPSGSIDNSLPDAQPGIDNALPGGPPDKPSNALPTTPSPKKK